MAFWQRTKTSRKSSEVHFATQNLVFFYQTLKKFCSSLLLYLVKFQNPYPKFMGPLWKNITPSPWKCHLLMYALAVNWLHATGYSWTACTWKNYFRLTIPLGFVILMVVYIFPLFVTGPYSANYYYMVKPCVDYGWVNLLYLNNIWKMDDRVSIPWLPQEYIYTLGLPWFIWANFDRNVNPFKFLVCCCHLVPGKWYAVFPIHASFGPAPLV